ncbi:hypothetical protein GRX01_07805 [Halobaculum sp. WSA2]|uniref:Uncharacterized protein n=1 Tax=Halobaculum saliterrae TaxID=2073113 RepID=A0A6B0SZ28_9EURY|nr:hypothetical protein [Halobaculum saliterrae]MXR41240.1 hypothetical protein [Halobaculum saliterrae]
MNGDYDEQLRKVYKHHFQNKEVSEETVVPYAKQARPLLIDKAEEGNPGDEHLITRERPTVTYGWLADRLGSQAAYVSNVLALIDLAGDTRDEPVLSSLVETASTVGPGHGFFQWDFLEPEDRMNNTSEMTGGLSGSQKETWKRYLRATYDYDW